MKNRKKIIILWIVALCLAAVAYFVTAVNVGYTQVSFINIGQGDSCFVRTERGSTILIDSGDVNGEYALNQFLRKNLVGRFDAIFLSHMHADHISGAMSLLEQGFSVDSIYVSDETEETDAFAKLSQLASQNDTKVVVIETGDYIGIDEIGFSVVATGCGDGVSEDENDNSVILRLDCGENSILFTGDASVRTEMALLDNELIDTDFLKVGHHGSATSSSVEFLDEVSPELSIISVGADNRYGHPSEKALSNHEELDIPIMRTDLHGTVTIIMNESDIKNIYGERSR